MIDNCLLYFLYSIIILSILIIIILSSNLEDNSNTQIISIISTLGLGGLLTLSSKYFSNDYCKDKKTNNSKLGGVVNENNTQLIEQKKSALKEEQDKILIKNQEIFNILKESKVSSTLINKVDINALYSSNDQTIEQIYNELLYKNIKSYSIPTNILPCYKSLLINYISSIKKEVVDKMVSSKVKEKILKQQPKSTAFTNKDFFLEPNGPTDPIKLNPKIFDKTTKNTKNNTENLYNFIYYLNTTIKMKDIAYLTEHRDNLSKAYYNLDIFNFNDQAQPKEEAKPQAQPKEEAKLQTQPKEEAKPQARPKGEAKPQARPKGEARSPARQQARSQTQAKQQVPAKQQAKSRGMGENNSPDKIFSTNYIIKNEENFYMVYNSQLDRSIKYINQTTDCNSLLNDTSIINSSNKFRNALNIIHNENNIYYNSLQNIFVLFIFNNNRYIQINENIKNYSQCFEIIEKELQQFQLQISELIRQNTYYTQQNELYKEQVEYYKEQTKQTELDYAGKIAQLNLDHENIIAQLNLDHDGNMNQLNQKCTGDIAQLTTEHMRKIEQLTKEHKTQLSELNYQKVLLEKENGKSITYLESQKVKIQTLKDQISSLVAENRRQLEVLATEHATQIEEIKSAHNAEILQLKELHKKEYTKTFDDRDALDKEYKNIHEERISKLKTEHETQLAKLAKQKTIFELKLKERDTSNNSLFTENLRLQKIEQEYNKYNPLFQKVIMSFKDQIEYYLNSTLTNHLDLENIKNDYKKEISNLKIYLSKNDNNENVKNRLTELKKIKEYYSEKEDFNMSFGIDEEKDKELLMSMGNLKNNIDTNIQYDINKLLETHLKVIYFQITLYTNFSLLHNLLLTTNKFQELLSDTDIKISRIDTIKYLDFNSDISNDVISYKNLINFYKNLFPNYDKIFGVESIINITLLNEQPEFKSLLSLFKYYINFYSKTTLLNKDSVQNINNTIKNIEDTYFKETKRLIEREKLLEKEFISNQTEFKTLYIQISNYINNKILKDANNRKLYINALVSRKSNNELIQTFINYIKENNNPQQYIIDDYTPLNYVLELIQFLLTLNSDIIYQFIIENTKLQSTNAALNTENTDLKDQIIQLKSYLTKCSEIEQLNNEFNNLQSQGYQNSIANSQENLKSFNEIVNALTSKQQTLIQEISNKKLQLDRENSTSIALVNESNDKAKQIQSLEIEITKLKEDAEVIASENEKIGENTNSIEAELKTLISQIQVLEEEKNGLEAELIQRKKSIEGFKTQIEENKSIITELNLSITQLNDFINKLNNHLTKQEYKDLENEYNLQIESVRKLIQNNCTDNYTKFDTLLNNIKNNIQELQNLETESSTKIEQLKKEKVELLKELVIYKLSLPLKDKKRNIIEEAQIKLLTENASLQSQLEEKLLQISRLDEIKKNQSIKIQELINQQKTNQTLSDNEKQRLESRIKELTDQNNKIEEVNNELSNKLQSLTTKLDQDNKDFIAQVQQANIDNENNIDKLKNIIKRNIVLIIKLNINNGRLNKLIEQLQKENKKIKQELESNKQLLQESKDTNKELIKNNQNLTQELELNKDQLEMIKATIETQKSKMQELITKNTTTNMELEELKKQIQILISANLQLTETNTMQESDLQSQKVECSKKLDKIKKDLDEKILELEESKKQNRTNANLQEFKNTNSLLNEIKGLKIIQVALEKEVENLKKKKSEELLQQEIKIKKEINKITIDKEFLENSNLSNEELNTKYLTIIEKLTQQLTDLQIENARLKTSQDEIIAKELEYIKKLKQTQTDLDVRQLELDKLMKQTRINSNLQEFNKASSLLDEIKELKIIQVALEKEIEELKEKKSEELLQLEITLKKEITKLIKDKEILENSNLSNEELNTKYLTTISDLTKQLAEIQKENGTLQATITSLMSTQKTINKEKEKLIMMNEDLTGKIELLNADITKWKSQLDNQQLQSDSKLRNYKDYIIKMQKKHQSQLEILNKTKNEIEQKLLNTERQLTECNLFKENIQMKLEEMMQINQTTKSQNDNEVGRLNQLLRLLRSENERLEFEIEENLQKYNIKYQELNSKISELTQNIENLQNDNRTLNEGIELQIDELQEQYKKELDAELTKLKIEYQKEREKLNKFITNLEQFMTRTNNSNNFKLIESQLKDLNDKYNNDMSNLKLLNTKLEFEKLNLSKKIQQLSNTVNLLNSSKIKDRRIRDTLDKELKDEIQRLKDFISKKEVDLNQVKLKAYSNETNLLNSAEIISQKENEIKKCKLIISQLEKSLQLKDEELKRFISQIEELKLKISTLESQITSLQVQTDINNQTKQIEIDRLNQEILNLQNDNRTLNEGIELQLQKINQQQVKQLEECKKQLIECKQKLDKCEGDLTSCQTLLTTCKTDLKDCKDNSDKTISKFQSELQISNAKLSQLEKDKQNLESQLTSLKEILSKSNDSTTTELLKLKESNDKLLNENKTLKETKPVTNIAPYDDIQVIYKYVEKPEKIHLNTKFNNVISTTAFDKFIMNNSLIY